MQSVSSNRIPVTLFAASFLAFAYFHQGGGWNQNARFAMVRAAVEQHTLALDSYLIYTRTGKGSLLGRIPIQNGAFAAANQMNVLVWRDAQNRPFAINGSEPLSSGSHLVDLDAVSATGDVSFARGHLYPNKAPGTSLIAVPTYWLIYHLEKLAGANPDDWWTLTLNAWLTSALSVGLISAIGVVFCYLSALALSEGQATASLATAIAFAFGTLYFSYATTLYEHNLIAAGLAVSFYLLYQEKMRRHRPRLHYLLISGLCAGYAAITNYIIAVVVAILGLYTAFAFRRKHSWFWFGLGVLGPFILICVYNQLCFGMPFTTNYRYQNPLFASESKAFLGVFITPKTLNGSVWNYAKEVFSVGVMVLISPFRGLFFSAPVLLMGIYGIAELFREKTRRAEAWLMTSALLYLLLFITHYNGWHGGWANGPRYLVPAIPFLAIPAVFGFIRFPKLSIALMALSIAIQFLTATVDPQSPIGVAGDAVVPNKALWTYDPLTEYVLPLFFSEHSAVSINPIGIYEGRINELFPPGSIESRWNSFNAGELAFPNSRWSLLPLVLICLLLLLPVIRVS